MKKKYLPLIAFLGFSAVSAQTNFDKTIDVKMDLLSSEIVMPVSPLQTQVMFVGGVDMVQTAETYGNAAGQTEAKEWHDFIGVTADANANGQYNNQFWVSVNHEMVETNQMIGDGGGMTVFKVQEDENGNLTIMNQTLTDGRSGKFFNVDFVNTVGETGMNCGGIQAPDGRIWTAEEWFRYDNESSGSDGGIAEVTDKADWTIETDLPGDINGSVIKKYQNFNWMVEIDPREAKAIRKQYNWGRQPFEGGAISNDMKTVYFGPDDNPAFFSKFVADTPGDFTQGKLYVYKHDGATKWIEIDNSKIDNMLNYSEIAIQNGATMYNRLEWVTIDTTTGMVYISETGRDDIGNKWKDEAALGAVFAPHHLARNTDLGTKIDSNYHDLYGRVLAFNPSTDEFSVLIEGGAGDTQYDNKPSASLKFYPEKHLSNPDGLKFMMSGGERFLIIQEDLNGKSHNRVPFGIDNSTCEMFLLPLSVTSPTVNDLIRITAVPHGAEVTGATPTPSGKTILFNVQHPNSSEMVNEYPFTHSVTIAVRGFEGVLTALKNEKDNRAAKHVAIYPNPVARTLHLEKAIDLAIYDVRGNRVLVARDAKTVDVEGLAPGAYVLVTGANETIKFIVE